MSGNIRSVPNIFMNMNTVLTFPDIVVWSHDCRYVRKYKVRLIVNMITKTVLIFPYIVVK